MDLSTIIIVGIAILISLASLIYVIYMRGYVAGDDASKEHMKHQDELIAELMKEHIEHLERESK